MSVFTTDLNQFFAPTQAYYEDLSLKVQQQGEENLAKTQQEIATKAAMANAPASNNTVYILLGVAAVALVTLAILKRKKII